MTSSSFPSSSTTAVGSLANGQMVIDQGKNYLCCFSVITGGQLDDTLGSDEAEIIEMINIIIDVNNRKVNDSV